MRKEYLLLMTIVGFFTVLIFFIITFYKPTLPRIIKTQSSAVKSDADIIQSLNSKVKSLEENIITLTNGQDNISKALKDVQAYISTTSAQPTIQPTTKSILAVANTKGSVFTTTSFNYTPMGMYLNIKCPKNCYLWINFFTSSQNLGTPVSAQGYLSTYGIFLDENDQSIYSQANFPAVSFSSPISLNAVLPVSSGTHTIDIRAKTSGGTLQSNVSFLQVMAIER